MKMETEVKITVKGIKQVENLIKLLEKYFKDLPIQLQTKLKKIEKNYAISDIDIDYVLERYGNQKIKLENSENLSNIISVNEILQKVVVWDKEKECLKTIYPNQYWLKINGDLICEW